MWKLSYADPNIKTESDKLNIFNPYKFWVIYLEMCHLSLKHSLPFNTFNRFNVNMESFQTIVISYKQISHKRRISFERY